MKVIHCPATEDPLQYARKASRKSGLTELFSGNGLIIALVVAMVIGTFTIGPLKPQPKDTPGETPVTVVTQPVQPVVYAEPVMCELPAGGRIQAGWEALIQDDEKVMQVRCEDNGTLKEIEKE